MSVATQNKDLLRYDEISDEDWKQILDESNITQSRKRAENKYKEMDTETYTHLRYRAKTDLFFLCGLMGFDRLSPVLHGHLCSWMERNADWRFRCELLPRGHFKSTVVTIGHSTQIVLPDVPDSGVPYPLSMGTDCRLLISHETAAQASNFLFAITGQFLGNPLLQGLFPEAIPSPRKQRINRHELELPRYQTWPEPTIDTMGVGGRSQGRHYNYIKFDDLIGDEARDSDTVMQSAKEWFDNIQSFFSNFSVDHFDLVGTRWAFDDLYSHVFERYGEQLLKYVRGVEEPVPDLFYPDGSPVLAPIFPEEFTLDALKILRKNRKIWTAQYANNPEEGATEFDKGWKRYYNWVGYNQIVVFSGQSQTRLNIRDLDICILYDPAMTGLAGIVVTGTDSLNRVFTLEALEEEWKPPEAVNLIFKLVSRYQPRLVAIEEVLFSGIYKYWFEAEMKLRGQYFNIFPVSPVVGGRAQSKPMRVRGLSNYFSAGKIFFNPNQTQLIKEYDQFGAARGYHMLDALAYGPDVWMPGLSRASVDKLKKAEEDLLAARDNETGYSN